MCGFDSRLGHWLIGIAGVVELVYTPTSKLGVHRDLRVRIPPSAQRFSSPPPVRFIVQNTLVLDQGYQPHRVVSWQRAVCMWVEGKVEIVEEYDEDIRSVSITIKMPAVVRLLHRVRGKRQAVKFSRINVATRDAFQCQYCGDKHVLSKLTYDHVIPRAHGGRTTWENIVMACYPCNEMKRDRTPEQAGMKLRKIPVKPAYLPVVTMRFDMKSIPDAWASYIYWNGALEEGA